MQTALRLVVWVATHKSPAPFLTLLGVSKASAVCSGKMSVMSVVEPSTHFASTRPVLFALAKSIGRPTSLSPFT